MKRIFLVFTVLIFALRLPAQTNAPTRLALIAESADASAVVDVLTAQLSGNKNLQLLERNEIEKVYREQGLSAGNKDYLKLGQILGADGLLLIETATEGTNQFLYVRLVAVKPGVVLIAEKFSWPVADLPEWSAVFANHLNPLLPKLTVLVKDAIPISVVNFHAGVRTTEAVELERQFFFLTVERLVREKRLFVLERKRMQALSEEKEMSSAEAEPFWNGKYLLDGMIDRNGFNPEVMTISARLIPPGGVPVLIEASGSRTNCVEVINQLAGKVLAALKLDANPAAWNTVDEADKFFKEAQWNLAWKIFPQARQSAEAAWALGKHDADCMNLRVRSFMPPPDSGVIYFPPREKPSPEKIDDAIQAARLFQEFSRNLPADEPKLDSDWYKLGLENLTIATRVLQQFNWSPEFYEPVADKLVELRAQVRTLAELLSRAPSVHDSYFVGSRKVTYDDLHHFEEKPSIYGLKMEGGCLWQEKPEDTLAFYRELMASPVFRYLHERLWFRDADHSSTRLPSPPRLVAWNNTDQKRLPELWQRFVTELKESPDVSLQMEARAIQLADTETLSKTLSMAGNPDAYKTALKKYDQELSSAFADFFDAFVTNRIYFKTNNVDVLYLDWGVNDLVERMGGDVVTDTKESLRNQYRTEYAAKLGAKDKELAQTVAVAEDSDAFEKQIKFLQDNQPYDPQAFVQIFIIGFKDYSREQAQEIKPLLAEYKKKLSGTWARIGEIEVGQVEAKVERILNPVAVAPPPPNRIAMTNGNPTRPPGGNFPPERPPQLGQPGTQPQIAPNRLPPDRETKPIAETPASEPLVSSNVINIKIFCPLPMDELPGDKLHYFRFTGHQLVEGKLLLDFAYNAWVYSFDENGNWKSSADKVFIGMAILDPETKHWTLAALPESFTEPVSFSSRQSVLWRGDLYSSHTGKIRKYDFQKKIWELAGFSVEGGSFYNLNGRLFIADYNSIQEITEDGRGTKLLASIQRQPPVTSLDSLGALMNLALFTDAQNSLCAAVHDKVFRWGGTDWREIGPASASFEPSVFEGGVLFLTDGWNTRPARISCFDTRSNILETCLVQPAQQPGQRGYVPRPATADVLLKPLWKLPTELSLPNLSAAYWQSNLFLMADHSEKQDIVAEERGTRPDGVLEVSHVITGETFLPKDGYDTALFCFSRGRVAAGKILLKFDGSVGCPPMAGLSANSQPMIPRPGITSGWMLFTPNFLLCARDSVPGNFKPGIWVIPDSDIKAAIDVQAQVVLEKKRIEDEAKGQLQEKLIAKYDRNRNGVVDPNEKEDALDDPAFIESELGAIDANHNGILDAEELIYFDANKNKILEPKEQAGIVVAQHLLAARLLKRLDANGDAVIDRSESINLQQSGLGTNAPQLFNRLDANHDGHVDLGELESFLNQQMRSGLRSRGMAVPASINQMNLGANQPVDAKLIFKAVVESYWQNPGSGH